MAQPPWMADEAWRIVQTAKAAAISEGENEISIRHLFQGCTLEARDVVSATLAEIGIEEKQIERYLNSVSGDIRGGDSYLGVALPVSQQAESVLIKARGIARDYPAEEHSRVAPVHLWVSLCDTVGELESWLVKQGWSQDVLKGLRKAAEKQLPLVKSAPSSALRESERAVLEKLCTRNLTELARRGRLSRAYGMDAVTWQAVHCLLRRDKRSVVLTGDAGVGKTKLVEDLALRIVTGEIPELAGCEIFELDLALLTRGTQFAGSRAERWAQLAEVLRAHPDSVILFIDELHTIVGLPLEGQAMDLSNALKPLLVDDRVRIIGATTGGEYRRYIEGDPALARRFSEVRVPEPDRDTVMTILDKTASTYGEYHGVKYLPETLESIYELTRLYLPNLSFPAKAIDLLDETGVMVRLRHRARPNGSPQGLPTVEVQDVREALKRVWGVDPGGSPVDVAQLLMNEVVGQDHAAKRLADVLITSGLRYGKQEQRGPRAVMLFLGPPGVGKSFMAQVLATVLFPGRDTLLTLDMTEFSGPHAAEHARFRLLGPPPPYVGWETGGVLTSHALRHPVSVVLVNEFEKADSEARNVLLGIFDEGWAQDGRGRIVSFKGIIFILTANAAQETWRRVRRFGFAPDDAGESEPSIQELCDQRLRELLVGEGFVPELLSRISHVVMFNNLRREHLEEIARRRLARLRDSALAEDSVLLEYDEGQLAKWLVERCGVTPDCRRLVAAFEMLIELPLARWRMGRRNDVAVVRLEPGEEEVNVVVKEKSALQKEVRQLLFKRVADLFAQEQQQEQHRHTARALLGG